MSSSEGSCSVTVSSRISFAFCWARRPFGSLLLTAMPPGVQDVVVYPYLHYNIPDLLCQVFGYSGRILKAQRYLWVVTTVMVVTIPPTCYTGIRVGRKINVAVAVSLSLSLVLATQTATRCRSNRRASVRLSCARDNSPHRRRPVDGACLSA